VTEHYIALSADGIAWGIGHSEDDAIRDAFRSANWYRSAAGGLKPGDVKLPFTAYRCTADAYDCIDACGGGEDFLGRLSDGTVCRIQEQRREQRYTRNKFRTIIPASTATGRYC
jgi:hypothetical protein